MVEAAGSHSAFFYGTLMHPRILRKVIQNDGSHLTIAPAVLLEHTRHEVKHADYPGVAPISQTQQFFDRPLTQDESSVRGTLVSGLTDADIVLLDVFEGSEYRRESVQVHPLGASETLSAAVDDEGLIPAHPPPLPSNDSISGGVNAETYLYNDISGLASQLWSFEDFVKKKAYRWYAQEATSDARDIRWEAARMAAQQQELVIR